MQTSGDGSATTAPFAGDQLVEFQTDRFSSAHGCREGKALLTPLDDVQVVRADADPLRELWPGQSPAQPRRSQSRSETFAIHASDTIASGTSAQGRVGASGTSANKIRHLPTATIASIDSCMAGKTSRSDPPSRPPARTNVVSRKTSSADKERARRLKEALLESGLTQVEVGRRIGVNEVSAYKLFNGLTAPREETLRGLCRVLNRSPSWILFGVGEKELDPATLDQPMPPVVAGHNPGLKQWLDNTPEGKSASPDERKWLMSIRWPEDPVRAPDLAYHYALQSYRALFPSRNR
jgi:transcriptional regulator with XRE-family HTH domain